MYTFKEVTDKDFENMAILIRNEKENFFVFPSATFPMTVTQIKERYESKKDFIKMLDGDNIIGFANLYDDEESKHIFIGNFVISKEYRSQGNGEKLITYMIELAKGKYQICEIRISIVNTNHKAFSWYIQLGFKPYGVEIFDENMKFVHMKMILS